MNKLAMGTILVLFILVLIYFIKPEEKGELDEKLVKEVESLPPPTSTGNDGKMHDIGSGAGLNAVQAQKRFVVNDRKLMQDIRVKKRVALNLFSGVEPKPAIMYRNFILSQMDGKDDTDITLIPKSVDDEFERSLNAALNYLNDFETNKSSVGEEAARRRLIELLDMSSSAGYSILPPYSFLESEIIDDGKGYGACKFPTEKKCRKSNWKKFEKDCDTIIKNFLKGSKEIDNAIQEAAIEILLSKGWKFVGYSQP